MGPCETKKRISLDLIYTDALAIEEKLLKKKSRVQWLKKRDKNSTFFFKTMTKHRNRNRIATINRSDGSIASSDAEIKDEAE